MVSPRPPTFYERINVEFVEVVEQRAEEAPNPAQRGAIEVRLEGNRVIRVESGADLALLRAVVEALEAR
jgi:hypothetical protein